MFVCLLFKDMFQERTRMSAAHEANTQRLTSALRDKESALQVRLRLQTDQLISYTPINSNRSLLFRLLFNGTEFARGVFLGFGSWEVFKDKISSL